MRALLAVITASLLSLGLGACTQLEEVNIFAEDVARAEAEAAAGPQKDPVLRISKLELGRLFRGYMLIAEGVAPGVGYYQPELRIRYDGQLAPDGFYEFDFVAIPPDEPHGADAPESVRTLRGDYQLTPQMLRGARGVRVIAANDSVEGRF